MSDAEPAVTQEVVPKPEAAVGTRAASEDETLAADLVDGWQRGADDLISIALHLGGAFACRNIALTGDGVKADSVAIGCCLFAVVFSSFFSNVRRPGAQWVAFVLHAGCIFLSLFLLAPETLMHGLEANGNLIPSWAAALFGSAMGTLAANGIGDVTND